MNSIPTVTFHGLRNFFTDIPNIRRVIEVVTYEWDHDQEIYVRCSEPVANFQERNAPLDPLESIGRPEDLGLVINSLPLPPPPPGPVPNLQEVIQMMKRRRQQMEEELTPSQEPMIPRFPHHRQHCQHRDPGDERRFSAGSGTWPGGQCHTGEKDRVRL